MSTVALGRSTVNLDKDHASINGPSCKKWCNQYHLENRDQSKTIQFVPSEIDWLTMNGLMQIGIILIIGFTWDNLCKEVHQSENEKCDHWYHNVQVERKWATLVIKPVLDAIRNGVRESWEQNYVEAREFDSLHIIVCFGKILLIIL